LQIGHEIGCYGKRMKPSHTSTNPENLAQVDPVVSEIVALDWRQSARFFPARYFRHGEKNFQSKFKGLTQHQTCVQILWQSIKG